MTLSFFGGDTLTVHTISTIAVWKDLMYIYKYWCTILMAVVYLIFFGWSQSRQEPSFFLWSRSVNFCFDSGFYFLQKKLRDITFPAKYIPEFSPEISWNIPTPDVYPGIFPHQMFILEYSHT